MSCTQAAAALAAMLGLAGCADAQRSSGGQPGFYADLGRTDAVVDSAQARAMISAYRMNKGLGILRLDAALSAAALREAQAMAASDTPASAEAAKDRLRRGGTSGPEVNLSAGYRTLAEAFSGWRDSAQHDRVMRSAGATRMGIATAYAPASKYKVYWALIVAAD
ncbi:MAG: CAP domain-containing protein [Hyphomicrobiales bacterium]|nr:CAP domain-containing protein [Hyphomicrobiales bacterium]